MAQLLGIIATLFIKIVTMVFLRNALVAGFYRKRMALANLLFMLLECWNVALSAGFLFARTAVFLLLAIFYIGRIDTPFLAHEVDKFDLAPNLSLDRGPVVYRKDLLLHESHRHPYLDRLAAIYLLKLNLGDSFATRAGSCWRLIYVLTLMPWLAKYRATPRRDGGEHEPELDAGGDMLPNRPTRRESILQGEVARLRAEALHFKTAMKSMRQSEVTKAPTEDIAATPKMVEGDSGIDDSVDEQHETTDRANRRFADSVISL